MSDRRCDVLNEPTTDPLLGLLHRLVDSDRSVIVIAEQLTAYVGA